MLFDKQTVLTTLRANLDKYATIYAEYLTLKKREMLRQLQDCVDSVVATRFPKTPVINVNNYILQSQNMDYLVAIAMVENTISDSIGMSFDEYKCYMMDEWDWKINLKNEIERMKYGAKAERED